MSWALGGSRVSAKDKRASIPVVALVPWVAYMHGVDSTFIFILDLRKLKNL